MDTIDLSVVVPYYESAATITRAVASLLGQDPEVREIIVVDDGSEDPVPRRIRELPRVRVTTIPHAGAGAARNRGWRSATSRFVAFLDADDEWMPDRTAVLQPILGSGARFVCGDAVRVIDGIESGIWSELLPRRPGPARTALVEGNYICQSTVVLARDLLHELGGYDEAMPAWEDIDLWWRAALVVEPRYVERVTVRYHVTPGSLSGQALKMAAGRLDATRRLLQRSEFLEVPERWKRSRIGEALLDVAYAECRYGNRRTGLGALAEAVAARPSFLATSVPYRIGRRAVIRNR